MCDVWCGVCLCAAGKKEKNKKRRRKKREVCFVSQGSVSCEAEKKEMDESRCFCMRLPFSFLFSLTAFLCFTFLRWPHSPVNSQLEQMVGRRKRRMIRRSHLKNSRDVKEKRV